MRAIPHRRVKSPPMQELSNLPGNNFNLGLETHETYWGIPSGDTSGCAGLATSFYRSCNFLLTTTCCNSFSTWVCSCKPEPVTPGPFCNPPHLCKPQRQRRASQSRCSTHCSLSLLETQRKTLSPRRGAMGRGLHAAVGLGMGGHQPPPLPALPFPSSAMIKHWHPLLGICAVPWKTLS